MVDIMIDITLIMHKSIYYTITLYVTNFVIPLTRPILGTIVKKNITCR